MDSINRNQPEHNHKDLTGHDAVKRIRHIVDDAESCFFVSSGTDARPMSVLDVDEAGSLWFMSAADSHKNAEVAADPKVRVYFQASKHAGFLYLDGIATISRDPARIRELWSPELATWFTEGLGDPRITLIRVVPTDGYYWDNKHGNLVQGLKIMVGAAIGKTLDDSIEGRVAP
ncbi:pyridoxamine 5'-phosphate oxidase family protein [Pseudoduganella sp. SL102]|uniref:General stress protein n=1 Tax=Pseudoduganella albidiflava TaxID=321983 RepID=A0A411X479_9BURK|nr:MULTISPECIES: pyridoxamine 5'-phosphate oxidase family protein [Pseudoduganella]QBI03678.1 general stress protein [Pseudoduganella albidiflava]WBS03785.1 pyridoxamine 5'-phosphate oxidase family protein [Pseudoduganella sp. SL102]GGY69784.1 general stress protein [Pseudoduganella albidiflava]